MLQRFDDEIKTLEHELVRLHDQKTDLEAKKNLALRKCDQDLIKSSFAKVIAEIKTTNRSAKRHLLKSLVKRITVDSETQAQVVFNTDFLISPRMAEPG